MVQSMGSILTWTSSLIVESETLGLKGFFELTLFIYITCKAKDTGFMPGPTEKKYLRDMVCRKLKSDKKNPDFCNIHKLQHV